MIHSAQLRSEHSAAKAEEAVRAREDLLAIVAHDLKNPLNAIQLNVKFAERSEAAQTSPAAARRSREHLQYRLANAEADFGSP